MMLLVLVNGFVGFVFFRSYQQGMPMARAALLCLIAIVGVTTAAVLGRMLAERSNRRKRSR